MVTVPLVRRIILIIALSAAGLLAEGTLAPVSADGELQSLLDRALKANPRVLAARCLVEQAVERHEELRGFFDPRLFAASGKAERARGVPGGTGWTSVADGSHELTAGVEMPLRPGFYLTTGAAERYLFDGTGDYDHLYQTLLGLRLRVPLMRDRGFAQYELDRAQALADYNAEVSGLIGLMQTVRHEVERAYVEAYATLASYEVSQQATERFRVLLDQARELTRLKVVPAYQVFPTEMELSLRLEEEAQARQVHDVSLVALQRQIGDGEPVTLAFGADRLVQVAASLEGIPEVDLDEALERRGAYLRLRNLADAVRADVARAKDDLRPDLFLNAALTWRGEDAHQPLGGEAILSDEQVGGELVVVWQRPLVGHAANSRISRARARMAEIKHQMATERNALQADLQSARQTYTTLMERLKLLERAKGTAQQTVTAEDERFRLGEGTSRNALDAQKDLTNALNRQARAAADILRALADYRYAAGYPETTAP
jgi:outer membrane protein TolC